MYHARKYEVSEDFFKNWSSDMAYILGFVTADGSIYENTLSVELQKKDQIVLEFLRSKIGPEYPITNTFKKKRKYCRIRFSSHKLVQSIVQYNLFPNKSNVIRANFNIPNKFIGDYVRGVFDGDGWIHQRRNSIEPGIVSGSKLFLYDLQRLCGGIGRIRRRLKRKKNGLGFYRPIYFWEFNKRDGLKLRELMYYSNGFCLERKKRKFFDFYIPDNRWWTDDQIVTINKCYSSDKIKALSDISGKSVNSIRLKRWRLGLAKPRPVWTEEQDRFLRLNKTRNRLLLAKELGVTLSMVQSKLRSLKLTKPQGKAWSKEERKFLVSHLDCPRKWIAKELGRSEGSVKTQKRKLTIKEKQGIFRL